MFGFGWKYKYIALMEKQLADMTKERDAYKYENSKLIARLESTPTKVEDLFEDIEDARDQIVGKPTNEEMDEFVS